MGGLCIFGDWKMKREPRYTLDELSRLLNIPKKTLYNLLRKKGAPKSVRVVEMPHNPGHIPSNNTPSGNKNRYILREVQAWIKQNEN